MSTYHGPERRRSPRAYVAAMASVFREGVKVGDYLADNISSGGAALLNGPELHEGALLGVSLRIFGGATLSLRARVVRGASRGGHLAFQRPSAQAQDILQRAVLSALERQGKPAVLVVHALTPVLGEIAGDLCKLRRRAILAPTPLDAIRWLCDPDQRIEVAMVERSLPSGIDGSEVLAFIGDDVPTVRRVLMSGGPADEGLEQSVDGKTVHAALRRPWTSERLSRALRGADSREARPVG